MDNAGSYSHAELRCAKRESQVSLHPQAGHGTHRSPSAPLELRDVHRLPEVILRCAWHVTSSVKIRQRIDRCLDAWEAREFEMLAPGEALLRRPVG